MLVVPRVIEARSCSWKDPGLVDFNALTSHDLAKLLYITTSYVGSTNMIHGTRVYGKGDLTHSSTATTQAHDLL